MTPTRTLAAWLAVAALAAPGSPQAPPTTPAAETPTTPPAEPGEGAARKPSAEEEKAAALIRAGKPDDALAELRKAAKANPLLPPPRVQLADLYIQAGQPQAARGQIERAAVEDPGHPAVYLSNASMAFGEGRLIETILACRAALTLSADPRWDADQRKKFAREARMGLAAAFEARGDWPSVKEHAVAALNEDPKSTLARQKLAAATFWTGGPEQAFAELQAAYKDDPTTDLPELRMAQLWAAKDEAKSEDWLKKAVAAHPRDPKAHRAYAAWLLDNGRPDAAQLYVDSAMKLDPTAKESIALKGLTARYKKDWATAEQVFDGLNREYPNDIFSAWNLALVLAETGDPSKRRRAVDLAESETRKNPRAGEGYAVLGWTYYKAGRLEDAEKALLTSASTGQVRMDTAYFLARVLAERGKTEEAYRLIKEAVGTRGPFVHRADAQALLTELEKQVSKKN